MNAAIGCPVVGDFPRGTDTAEPLTSTPDPRSPHPVASDNGMADVRTRNFLYACHHRLVNGYRTRTLIPSTLSDVVPVPSITQVAQIWPNPHRLC
jgi:hypothetical protein